MNKENSKIKIALLVLSIAMLIAANAYFIYFFGKAAASCYGLFSGPYVETTKQVDMVLNLSNSMQTGAGKGILLFIALITPLIISILFLVQKRNISIPAFINSTLALLLIVITISGGMILNSACENLKGSMEINHSIPAGMLMSAGGENYSGSGSGSSPIVSSAAISSGIVSSGMFSPDISSS